MLAIWSDAKRFFVALETMLNNKIINCEAELVFYGLTPPKSNNDEDKIRAIVNKQMERLVDLEIDGLVLYDIQDESSRTDHPRPFPFLPTISPEIYSHKYLDKLKIPRIIYKSIGSCSKESFKDWLAQNSPHLEYMVLVGTPSKHQVVNLSLHEAYDIKRELDLPMLLGGVTIPERHLKKGDEHLRVFDKIDRGCSFFISQCVYSVSNSKNFLSDYYYTSLETNRKLAPVIFTLTPCGSVKTLQFMEWLGIEIPKWLSNDLIHSKDILSKSMDVCRSIAEDLLEYSRQKNIPIGFNIESVSIRKEEIEASIELVKDVKQLLK